ncbi:hypothetical protein P7L87_25685 [Vibrio parahaemolyticus]|nr:hypothetical protein [Vibrio parahaemolyticus]
MKRNLRLPYKLARRSRQPDSPAVTATRGESAARVLRHHVVFALLVLPLLALLIGVAGQAQ